MTIRKSGPSTGTEGLTVSRTATATAGPFFTKEDAMGESGGVAALRGMPVSEMVDAGSALTLGAGSGALLDAPSASGAFVTEWTVERATGAGAVVPGSEARAAANAVAAPASARTTPMTVSRLASRPNLMASPRNTG